MASTSRDRQSPPKAQDLALALPASEVLSVHDSRMATLASMSSSTEVAADETAGETFTLADSSFTTTPVAPTPTAETQASGRAELDASRTRTATASAGSELPTPEPEVASPAYWALERANERTDPSLLARRVRFGKAKLGRTRYQAAERSFKRPAGKEIHFQHEQYALTYGMMCGILNSAGLQNPFKQRLTMDDFMLVDKRVFPANAKLQHPFKFKDYAPDVFRQVRRRCGIDSADYMVTLCGDFNFIEFLSNSKSGQFFFYSHDGRFMIKTQTKDESRFLRRILPHYYQFVMENPNTLVTRFYGMHRVKMHHLRRKMHFVIMASVFDTPREIHARFDLKGSRVGRRASNHERRRGSSGVLKDMDLLDSGFRLQMGVERRAMFLMQLRKDVEFLQRMKIMDYSLLIGVHDSRDELHDRLYTANAGVEADETRPASKSLPTSPASSPPPDHGVTRVARSASLPEESSARADEPLPLYNRLALSPPSTPTWSDGQAAPDLDSDCDSEFDDSTSSESGVFARLGDFSVVDRGSGGGGASLPSTPRGRGSSGAVPPVTLSPRLLETSATVASSASVFCKDDGGICGRDRHGRKNGFVYFLGVIDILQQFNTRKITESFFKGLRHNRRHISAVNPVFYGDRFIEFMEKHVVQDDTLPSPRVRAMTTPGAWCLDC